MDYKNYSRPASRCYLLATARSCNLISISDNQSAGQEGLELHELCIRDRPTDFKHSLKILVHFLQRKLVKEEANLTSSRPLQKIQQWNREKKKFKNDTSTRHMKNHGINQIVSNK